MTPAQRHYLQFETLISAAINGVLSAAFVILTFGGQSAVSAAELVHDAAPQTFFVTMFTIVVPGLLTRRRIRNGAITPLSAGATKPWPIAVRALAIACGVTAALEELHALVLPQLPGDWHWPELLLYKVAYGAGVGAAVARLTLPTEMTLIS